ncbi:MAG: hypothetical protein QOI90_546, partial [Mycobacterium sp.]|nr:hypothetical protein [Mycobacterium sp.]
FVLRAFADMAMLTMSWEERELISVSRRPKLGSRRLVMASLRLLSKGFGSSRGQALFDSFLGEHIAGIYRGGVAADEAPGGRTRAAQFVVPDAAPCLVKLADLSRNWPGSPERYALGAEGREDTATVAKPTVLRRTTASS